MPVDEDNCHEIEIYWGIFQLSVDTFIIELFLTIFHEVVMQLGQCHIMTPNCVDSIINRPNVVRAVLQTASLLIH